MGEKSGSQIAKELTWESPVKLNETVSSQQEAKDVAVAQLEARSIDFISANATCIGRPDIKARKVIQVKGVGRRYSGNYYVTSVTHTIDSQGYKTTLQLKRNAR